MLLTGASQGIGKAIGLELARRRDSVLGLSRTPPADLTDTTQSPSYFSWKPLDLSDVAEVVQCASSLESIAIRALILCAVDYGGNERRPVSETSADEWQRAIGTNCLGHCLLVSRLLPKLIANSPGIIVNLSSDVAVLPAPGRAPYAASKAGLHAMLRAVAAEHSADRLRVYQLIPTFQMVTGGIRNRRPVGFDFSSYVDPALIAQVLPRFLSPGGDSIAPGTYLIRRDGSLKQYSEINEILGAT